MNRYKRNFKYKYPASTQITFYFLALGEGLGVLYLVLILVDKINAWIRSGGQESDLLIWDFLVIPLVTALTIFFINLTLDIGVDDDGIRMQTFIFWSRAIPFTDIIGIKDSVFGDRIVLLIVNNLPTVYRLYGMLYGFTLKPVVPIFSHLQHRGDLLHTIKTRMRTRFLVNPNKGRSR